MGVVGFLCENFGVQGGGGYYWPGVWLPNLVSLLATSLSTMHEWRGFFGV